MLKRICTSLFFIALLTFQINAQSLWNDIKNNNIQADHLKTFKAFTLNSAEMEAQLRTAPLEFTPMDWERAIIISMPMPDGSLQDFEMIESPLMPDALAAKFPLIKTYLAQGLDDRTATMRLTISQRGIQANILSINGTFFIEPYENDIYISYDKKDLLNQPVINCGLKDHGDNGHSIDGQQASSRNAAGFGDQLRVFDTAIAATGEFTQSQGGTDGAMAEIVNALSFTNNHFEKDLAVRMVLVADNDQLIFTNPDTDPYPSGQEGFEILYDNPGVVNSIIGAANIDISHVFTTFCTDGIGGVAAYRGSACDDDASAVTCASGNYFDTMLHEIGHQLGAAHTWSNCNADNAGQLTDNSAYEPGSGTTIMSYAGACGDNNVSNDNDLYYHARTLRQVDNYLNGNNGSCHTEMATNNNPPIADAGTGGFFIPISTPFELIGEATDEDDDELTYCWEQYNLGPTTPLGEPTGSAPSFRSFPPKNSPIRTFPRLNNILFGTTSQTEVLPTYGRNLTFNLTVRDNKAGGGGVDTDLITFNSTAGSGPFLVEYPNGDEELETGQQIEITWDVANTTSPPVSCQNVNILLSNNFGYEYNFVLAENTPNDGSEIITVPNVITNFARIKIKAADNIFFDISNDNFKIAQGSVSTTEIEDPFKVTILPNPAKDYFNIAFQEIPQGNIELSLYNMQGQLMETYQYNQVSNQIKVDAANLPRAIYLVKIKTNEQQIVKKVMLQ